MAQRKVRKVKKKVCPLCADKNLKLDYKNADQLKKFIKKYAGHPLLTEKIKNSTPVRPDYKLFRFLFLNKLTLFIYLFFNIKKIFLKISTKYG